MDEVTITKEKQVGRPSKYDPKYADGMVFFFEKDPNYEKEIEHYDDKGNLKWTDYKLMANPFPTFLSYAKQIGVHYDTLVEWANAKNEAGELLHPEFSEAYKRCKELQKWFLIENGLNGVYNPTFAIFTAKNVTDMRDQPTSLTQINAQRIIVTPIPIPDEAES